MMKGEMHGKFLEIFMCMVEIAVYESESER